MKKIFVSVPMNGRSNDDIKYSFEKMKAITEAILGEEVEIVNPFVPKNSKTKPLEDLGRGIVKMAKAEYLVSCYDAYEYRGCQVENYTANEYGIKILRFDLEFICPDVARKRREAYEACVKSSSIPVCADTQD